MRKLIKLFTIVFTFGVSASVAFAQDTNNVTELVDGMDFHDGVFYPSHSFSGAGLTYVGDGQWVAQSSSSEGGGGSGPAVLGYPDASHLPDPAPFLANFLPLYNPSGAYNFLNSRLADAGYSSVEAWVEDMGRSPEELAFYEFGYQDPHLEYYLSLTPFEQASLYRAVVEDGVSVSSLVNSINAVGAMNPVLKVLPSGEAGSLLNYVYTPANLNLSEVNLSGFDTVGKDLYGVNFVGSNITVAQLNASANLDSANLSGVNLVGLDTEGKSLNWGNLSQSVITAAQVAALSDFSYANLSGTGVTRAQLEALGIDAWWLDTVIF